MTPSYFKELKIQQNITSNEETNTNVANNLQTKTNNVEIKTNVTNNLQTKTNNVEIMNQFK